MSQPRIKRPDFKATRTVGDKEVPCKIKDLVAGDHFSIVMPTGRKLSLHVSHTVKHTPEETAAFRKSRAEARAAKKAAAAQTPSPTGAVK